LTRGIVHRTVRNHRIMNLIVFRVVDEWRMCVSDTWCGVKFERCRLVAGRNGIRWRCVCFAPARPFCVGFQRTSHIICELYYSATSRVPVPLEFLPYLSLPGHWRDVEYSPFKDRNFAEQWLDIEGSMYDDRDCHHYSHSRNPVFAYSNLTSLKNWYHRRVFELIFFFYHRESQYW